MTISAVLRQKGRAVVSVAPDASVAAVAEIIASQRIGAVVVVDTEQHLLGIVSERDVVKALSAKGAEVLSLKASDLMTRDVVTATRTCGCAARQGKLTISALHRNSRSRSPRIHRSSSAWRSPGCRRRSGGSSAAARPTRSG